MATKVDLVFRSIGERTAPVALDLAQRQIQPNRIHCIDHVKPFSQAVRQMLQIHYNSDFVVFMDADCLILENLRPFLDRNTQPFIDSYVHDKFRGAIHCGVHITRVDVVHAMQAVIVDANHPNYVLRPEFYTREQALARLGLVRIFKPFAVLHDFGQYYRDIFSKYVLRELRSRSAHHRSNLSQLQAEWVRQEKTDLDFKVANAAIAYAREQLPISASASATAQFIAALPEQASAFLAQLGISEKAPLTPQELQTWQAHQGPESVALAQKSPIFVLSQQEQSLRQLVVALNRLGFSITYDPKHPNFIQPLLQPDTQWLNDFDGIADPRLIDHYASLQQRYPQSRWIIDANLQMPNPFSNVLSLDMDEQLRWQPLCEFLGTSEPHRPLTA